MVESRPMLAFSSQSGKLKFSTEFHYSNDKLELPLSILLGLSSIISISYFYSVKLIPLILRWPGAQRLIIVMSTKFSCCLVLMSVLRCLQEYPVAWRRWYTTQSPIRLKVISLFHLIPSQYQRF